MICVLKVIRWKNAIIQWTNKGYVQSVQLTFPINVVYMHYITFARKGVSTMCVVIATMRLMLVPNYLTWSILANLLIMNSFVLRVQIQVSILREIISLEGLSLKKPDSIKWSQTLKKRWKKWLNMSIKDSSVNKMITNNLLIKCVLTMRRWKKELFSQSLRSIRNLKIEADVFACNERRRK